MSKCVSCETELEKASSGKDFPGEGEDAFCIFTAPVAPMVGAETGEKVDAPYGAISLDSATGQEDEASALGTEEAPEDFNLDLVDATIEETATSVPDKSETLAEVKGDVEFDFDPDAKTESGEVATEPEVPAEVEGDVEFDFEPELELDSPELDSNDPNVSEDEDDQPDLNIAVDEDKS